jgi:hypothetical protein
MPSVRSGVLKIASGKMGKISNWVNFQISVMTQWANFQMSVMTQWGKFQMSVMTQSVGKMCTSLEVAWTRLRQPDMLLVFLWRRLPHAWIRSLSPGCPSAREESRGSTPALFKVRLPRSILKGDSGALPVHPSSDCIPIPVSAEKNPSLAVHSASRCGISHAGYGRHRPPYQTDRNSVRFVRSEV